MQNSSESKITYREFRLSLIQICINYVLRIHEHSNKIANDLILAGIVFI